MTPRDCGILRVDPAGPTDPYGDWSVVYREQIHAAPSVWLAHEILAYDVRHGSLDVFNEMRKYLSTGVLDTEPRPRYLRGTPFSRNWSLAKVWALKPPRTRRPR